MAYITSDQLKTYVAAILRQRGGADELDQIQADSFTQGIAYGYGEIRTRLLSRGFESSDIDSWDRRVEFSKDLGAYRVLCQCGQFDADDTWVEKYNRAAELDTISLLVNDELVSVSSDQSDVKYGTMAWMEDTRETFIGGDEE